MATVIIVAPPGQLAVADCNCCLNARTCRTCDRRDQQVHVRRHGGTCDCGALIQQAAPY